MAESGRQAPQLIPTMRKERSVKQRVGPISYHLYSLFMNCLLHKKVPEEQVLVEAGMKTSVDEADGTNRRQKFLAWSKKMTIRVSQHPITPDVQVVSLVSKKTNKEIVPKEHFRHLIREIHTRNGRPGQNHLPIHSTVSEIKHKFTFGRRDFGMCEELVRDVINECDALHCYAKIYCKTYKKPDNEAVTSLAELPTLTQQQSVYAAHGDPADAKGLIAGVEPETKVSSLVSVNGVPVGAGPRDAGSDVLKKQPAPATLQLPSTAGLPSTLAPQKSSDGEPPAISSAQSSLAAPHISGGIKRKLDESNDCEIGGAALASLERGCSRGSNAAAKPASSPVDSEFRETYVRLLHCLGDLRHELLWTACGHPLAYEKLCQSFSTTEELVRTCKEELTKCSTLSSASDSG